MATDWWAALRNALNALSACPTVVSANSRTASGTCIFIAADFSIDVVVGASSPPIRRFGKTRFLDAVSLPILCLRRSLLDVTPRPLGQCPYFYFAWQVVWLAAFRWSLELAYRREVDI